MSLEPPSPGLASAGVAEDGHELGAPVADNPRVDELEQLELLFAADVRRHHPEIWISVSAICGFKIRLKNSLLTKSSLSRVSPTP